MCCIAKFLYKYVNIFKNLYTNPLTKSISRGIILNKNTTYRRNTTRYEVTYD